MSLRLPMTIHNRKANDWYFSFYVLDDTSAEGRKHFLAEVEKWMEENGLGKWMIGHSHKHGDRVEFGGTAMAFEEFKDEFAIRLTFGHLLAAQTEPLLTPRVKFDGDGVGRMPWNRSFKGMKTWHRWTVYKRPDTPLEETMLRLERVLDERPNGNYSIHVMDWNERFVIVIQDYRDAARARLVLEGYEVTERIQ